MTTHVLRLGYGTSRGRDTYGYNIVRLTDETTGRTFRTVGGGYDMRGTVLADWLVDTCQDHLVAIADRAYYVAPASGGYRRTDAPDALYGMARYEYGDAKPIAPVRVHVDGACGEDSVMRILETIGATVTRTFVHTGRRRGETTGWLVDVPELAR